MFDRHVWLSVLAIAFLMVVHECGHFFMARAFGMRVNKFSIGFGPTFFKIAPRDGYYWFTTAADKVRLRLWKHDEEKHGPTVYQVAMIPFLAYVHISGMNPFEEIEETDKGSYANASLLGRVLTIFAGPAANYLFASVLFFATIFFGGKIVHGTDVTVIDGRPAAAAQMKSGDKIVSIDGVAVAEWRDMAAEISKHPAQTVPIVVDRKGERVTILVTPANERGAGKIGVAPASPGRKVPATAREAAVEAVTAPPLVVKTALTGLADWATGRSDGELSGFVGMVRETAKVARRGWFDLFDLLATLSAYLGAFNLLPIPALDGARLMFLGYEATTRRRANARIEAQIHAVGLVMMLGLMAYVTVNDIRRGDRSVPAAPSALPSASPSGGSSANGVPSAAPSGGK